MSVSAADPKPLPPALADEVAFQLERFAEVAEPAQRQALKNRPEVPRVWAASEFVRDWCIRNPALCEALITSGELDRAPEPGDIAQQLEAACDGVQEPAALDRQLRAFRNRVMVRTAWRDLAGFSNLEETMASVSELADGAVNVALAHHHRWLSTRHGLPVDEDGLPLSLVVLGLGKLGGGELNYSSDIDLIFAYRGAGQTAEHGPDGEPATGKTLDNQEYFIKLGQRIVASLNRKDAGGFVFRTDMRLRPNGDSGPLVLPFAAMEHYYQIHGRDWERYALIKARVIAGDAGDGRELLSMLRPFVYRRYLDFSAFDAIREMKRMIERELAAERNARDVKLGRGGIREIEFLVQNDQLIRGGRETALQTTSLYEALEQLVALGMVEVVERETLIAAYRFLRNVEHRLQMVADRQTQTLPDDGHAQLRLAVSMGFEDWEAFESALNGHRDAVHGLFSTALADQAASGDQESDDSLAARLSRVWSEPQRSEHSEAALETAGFQDPGRIIDLLLQFRSASRYRNYSNQERRRLDRLMPLALSAAGAMGEGDRAITALIAIIEAIGHRSVYLSLLIENPQALTQLLNLCGASPWISRHIGQHPVVLDELLGPLHMGELEDKARLRGALEHSLAQVDADDVEARLNVTREFYHARVLRVAAADQRGRYSATEVHHALSLLAEVLLTHSLEEALARVEEKQGPPPGAIGLIAYGKFAGHELGYHSDLDIVVCFEAAEGSSHSDAEYYFSRVGQRLIHLITTRTRAGVLFELDMRLRPSGRSGTLVTSLKAFGDYQRDSAWTWEHQALVRARLVVGDETLEKRFEAIRQQILGVSRDAAALGDEVRNMRQRMIDNNSRSTVDSYDLKLDRGGIVDIEFLLQYLVLNHGADHPPILLPRNTAALIEALGEAGLLEADEANRLGAVWQTYLRESLNMKLLDRPLLIAQDALREERLSVTKVWQRIFGND